MFSDITFPVYRKYQNNKHFFKIVSKNCFEEVQLVGNKKTINLIHAKRLPELNHIYDLVYKKEVAIQITKEEYNSI